jgi:hypothetical protein
MLRDLSNKSVALMGIIRSRHSAPFFEDEHENEVIGEFVRLRPKPRPAL